MSSERKDKPPLYSSERPQEVRYEVVRLPFQDQVAGVRKALCRMWGESKAQWQKVENGVENSVSKARKQTKESLNSIGVRDHALAAKVTAIGGAGVLGLIMARRRSTVWKVVYPAIAMSVVAGFLNLSSVEKRGEVREELAQMRKKYLSFEGKKSGHSAAGGQTSKER